MAGIGTRSGLTCTIKEEHMGHKSIEAMKEIIKAGLHSEFQEKLAVDEDAVLACAVRIRQALASVYPLTFKEWNVVLQHIGEYSKDLVAEGKTEYKVYGCNKVLDKFEKGIPYTHVERTNNYDADFWGIYRVLTDGSERWIADFLLYDDAVMFALKKEGEENARN